MTADPPTSVADAARQLRASTSVAQLLGLTARAFVEVLDAPACTISRVIGDLLVDLVQHQRAGKPDRLGHGYLISDYPLTRSVIESREPRSVYARRIRRALNNLLETYPAFVGLALALVISNKAGDYGLVVSDGTTANTLSTQQLLTLMVNQGLTTKTSVLFKFGLLAEMTGTE